MLPSQLFSQQKNSYGERLGSTANYPPKEVNLMLFDCQISSISSFKPPPTVEAKI